MEGIADYESSSVHQEDGSTASSDPGLGLIILKGVVVGVCRRAIGDEVVVVW